MFDSKAYQAQFDAAIEKLTGAEKITKAILLDLSRSVLVALHVTEDIGNVNRLVAALTPVNRKVAILYFQEFTGFKGGKDGLFTSKDKKNYEEVKAKAVAFLEDPLNNIWSWADRAVEIEKKDFDIERMKKQAAALVKKVNDNHLSQVDLLKAMLDNGLTVEALLSLMDVVKEMPEPKQLPEAVI